MGRGWRHQSRETSVMKAPHISPAAPSAASALERREYVPLVKVNTVGYPTSWQKIAVFNVPPTNVAVKDLGGRTVLALPPTCVQRRGLDPASQDDVWQV